MLDSKTHEENCFTAFKSPTVGIDLPERFTFPFYYQPHPLSVLAAQELQEHLMTQNDWTHNFGIDAHQEGLVIGKMFGVLVVQKPSGELGYLAAFSGKLADANLHPGFVPPIFDMLTEGGFFKEEEIQISAINDKIEKLEANPVFHTLMALQEEEKEKAATQIANWKSQIKASKKIRKARRKQAEEMLDSLAVEEITATLRQQSLSEQYYLKQLNKHWSTHLENVDKTVAKYRDEIELLKQERKDRSNALQKKLFNQYQFLNNKGEIKTLLDIFEPTNQPTPPAGAGECAAPKLLQYAFKHQLKPICMAEFWWGESPKSEIRQHQQFYAACKGKCEPILGHMLKGIKMDDNPMLQNPAEGKKLTAVYEDEHIVVINKPAEFLSVPGKTIEDSVYLRMYHRYPEATGPLIVHRLDMATSGLLLIAKHKVAHKKLQYQFINRIVKKRYVALLDGVVEADSGYIELPLRVDLDDRPRQLVCYEHGKDAKTKFEVIERRNNQTLVYFYPITGRTHQLRVHAAHSSGLNTPIVGDDLYGKKSRRLHLHAEWIQFLHPITREEIELQVDPDFIA